MMAHIFNPSAQRQRQVGLFEASLGYRTQRNPVLKKKKEKSENIRKVSVLREGEKVFVYSTKNIWKGHLLLCSRGNLLSKPETVGPFLSSSFTLPSLRLLSKGKSQELER